MKNILIKIGVILTISLPIVAILLIIDSNQENNNEEKIQGIQSEETYQQYNPKIDVKKEEERKEEKCINCHIETTTVIETKSLKQSAWIPPWDYANGINSLNSFTTEFYSVSPVTFYINADGSITPRLDTTLSDLKNITNSKNIKVIPTISNFDWQLMKGIFDNPENTQRHINAIAETVRINNYDGIDLDYESISETNKEHFLKFIQKLAHELHKENKILSITVLAKWGDGVIYTGLKETREVQDWGEIGKYADEVRIMTYDYTPPGNSIPGPIGPINWMEKVLKYAVEKIPEEKIWLGVHLYSYEWVMPTQDINSNAIKTNSYTYNVVKNNVLTRPNININYNTQFEEGYADYPCDNNYCIIYYATPEGIQARQNLANQYNIAGVIYWRLGGEADLIK